MPNSLVVEESIHSGDSLHRIVAISIDENSAEYIYDWAVNNFINPATDLVVLLNCRTVDPPSMAPYINPTGFMEEFDDTKKQKSHKLLKHYADRIKAKQVAVRAIALAGEPKQEIVRKVKELKADVLLIGSRQLGAVKRTLLGSVSDYCAHNAHCTVVTIKANPTHPEGKHEMRNIFHRKSQ